MSESMTLAERVRQAKANDPALSSRQLGRMFGVADKTASKALRGEEINRRYCTRGGARRVSAQCPVVKGKEAALSEENSGVAGFRELHNYERQQERRAAMVRGLIEKCIDAHLRRSAALTRGVSENKAPRGWFYDCEGPKLAHVTLADWAMFRDEYVHMQLTVSLDSPKGGERIAWVDPDDVERYRKALEE